MSILFLQAKIQQFLYYYWMMRFWQNIMMHKNKEFGNKNFILYKICILQFFYLIINEIYCKSW